MGGAPYKSDNKGVGTLSSVSAFNHERVPTSCWQQLDAPKANNWTKYKVKFWWHTTLWTALCTIYTKNIHADITLSNKLTLAYHSSILWVAIGAGNIEVMRTVNEVTLITTASNIIQVNWASTSTKMSTAKGYCTCWHKVCLHSQSPNALSLPLTLSCVS